MQSKSNYKIAVNKIIVLPLILIIFGFIEIVTLTINFTNLQNSFTFTHSPSLSTVDDLYFSIGPTGEPQYGQTVSWNVPNGTNADARFYHLKKGDFGLAAIENDIQYISYSGVEVYDPLTNPDVDMTNQWIKVETAWGFAPSSYNIVVIAFTNQSETVISNGIIEVSIPLSANLNFQELKIYNAWINSSFSQTNNYNTNSNIFSFDYEDLQPDEIRYVYLYMNLGVKDIKEKRSISQFDITANMIGFGTDVLTSLVNPIPHDPNAMYLMNTYFQGSFTQCNDVIDYPDMYKECLNKNISWFGMEDTSCEKDEYAHIIEPTWDVHYEFENESCYITEYPYCHLNTEDLYYRVSCFNDGAGIAKDITIESIFETPSWEPFEPANYQLLQTTNYSLPNAAVSFNYPEFKFEFRDIHLPGLADPDVVRMYSECSTSLNYKASTLCNINEAILAESNIVFTDLNNNAQAPIYTNKVIAVPYEPLNDWDYCHSCYDGQIVPKPNDGSLKNVIEVFNMNGYKLHSTQIGQGEAIILSNYINNGFSTGVYIIRITKEGETTTIKYFHAGL